MLGDLGDLLDQGRILQRLGDDEEHAVAGVAGLRHLDRLVELDPGGDHEHATGGERPDREPQRRPGDDEAARDGEDERGDDQRQHPRADDQRHELSHVALLPGRRGRGAPDRGPDERRRARKLGRLESRDVEARAAEGRRGVAVWVTAAGEPPPRPAQAVLPGAERPDAGIAYVLEQEQPPPGRNTRATSDTVRAGSSTVHRTRVEATVSKESSAKGSDSAPASTTSYSNGGGELESFSRNRRAMCGSGSVSTSSVTAAG